MRRASDSSAARSPADQQRRLAELILYIAERSEDDPNFGAIKLNKLLFFADFMAYARLGRSITGAAYRKLALGPAPRDLVQVRDKLVKSRRAAEKRARMFAHEQKRLIALDEPNLDMFTASDVAIVEEVLTELRSMSAADVTEKSHLLRGWELARIGEEIPYYTVYLAKGPPVLSEDEQAFAERLIADSA